MGPVTSVVPGTTSVVTVSDVSASVGVVTTVAAVTALWLVSEKEVSAACSAKGGEDVGAVGVRGATEVVVELG